MDKQYVVHPDVIGHIRKMLERLDDIEARIEIMSNTQDKMWEYLDEVEDHVMMPWTFTELMEEQDGID